jgi:hypothetical protein
LNGLIFLLCRKTDAMANRTISMEKIKQIKLLEAAGVKKEGNCKTPGHLTQHGKKLPGSRR